MQWERYEVCLDLRVMTFLEAVRDWFLKEEPMEEVWAPPTERMRRLTLREVQDHMDEILASPYPECRNWLVCEVTYDKGKTWVILLAYPNVTKQDPLYGSCARAERNNCNSGLASGPT